MKMILPIFASICLGCGGGSGTSGGNTINSPFAGTWAGDWVSPAANRVGTAVITIASNGQVNGSVRDNTVGADGTVAGTISNAGSVQGVLHYEGIQDNSLSGTLAIGQSGHLTGNLTQSNGVNSVGVIFDLIKQ